METIPDVLKYPLQRSLFFLAEWSKQHDGILFQDKMLNLLKGKRNGVFLVTVSDALSLTEGFSRCPLDKH